MTENKANCAQFTEQNLDSNFTQGASRSICQVVKILTKSGKMSLSGTTCFISTSSKSRKMNNAETININIDQ